MFPKSTGLASLDSWSHAFYWQTCIEHLLCVRHWIRSWLIKDALDQTPALRHQFRERSKHWSCDASHATKSLQQRSVVKSTQTSESLTVFWKAGGRGCHPTVVLRLKCASESPVGLLNYRSLGPTHRPIRICISNKFPGDADVSGLGSYYEKHHSRLHATPTNETGFLLWNGWLEGATVQWRKQACLSLTAYRMVRIMLGGVWRQRERVRW